jgi:hypothetical protein
MSSQSWQLLESLPRRKSDPREIAVDENESSEIREAAMRQSTRFFTAQRTSL